MINFCSSNSKTNFRLSKDLFWITSNFYNIHKFIRCGHCKNLAPEWQIAGETFLPEEFVFLFIVFLLFSCNSSCCGCSLIKVV